MNISRYTLPAARFLALVSIFTLIAYPTIERTTLPIACLLMLFSGVIHKNFKLLIANRFISCAVLLVILFAVGISYGDVPLSQGLTGFFKYNKLLYLLFLIPLFTELYWRRAAVNTIILAMLVDIIISLLNLYGIASLHDFHHIYPGGYITYPINTTVILAFVAYVLGYRALNEEKYRKFYLILCLISIYILFFEYIERTGQVVFLALVILSLWQKMHWKGILIGLLIVPLIAGSIFLVSNSFENRVEKGYQEFVQYSETGRAKDTSVGLRLAFAEYSWKVIKMYPFFGAGTGSFKTDYAATQGPVPVKNSLLQDPHNEYVMITFQIGFVGLALFLSMLILQWFDAKRLVLEDKHLAQAVIVSFVVTGLFNTALFIGLSGLFYIIFSSVFFAARPIQTNEI